MAPQDLKEGFLEPTRSVAANTPRQLLSWPLPALRVPATHTGRDGSWLRGGRGPATNADVVKGRSVTRSCMST